jgi:hydrogenase maturation protease
MTDHIVQPILIAACGNALAGDDAFGPLVAHELSRQTLEGADVVDLDMRPAGLLDHLPGRRAVILIDAALHPGTTPGELVEMDFFAPGRPTLCADRATSTHALSIAGQLELAQALSLLPATVLLLALIVEKTGVGTDAVLAPAHVPAAVAILQRLVRALKMNAWRYRQKQ